MTPSVTENEVRFKSVLPPPDARVVSHFEEVNRIKLPLDYRTFLGRANGAIPEQASFNLGARDRVVERFLPLLGEPAQHPDGAYDINVVVTQIGERLTADADEVGCKLIPVAALFAGDFLCLDFRANASQPEVVVWDHERSDEFAPSVMPVAKSFTDFLQLLR